MLSRMPTPSPGKWTGPGWLVQSALNKQYRLCVGWVWTSLHSSGLDDL